MGIPPRIQNFVAIVHPESKLTKEKLDYHVKKGLISKIRLEYRHIIEFQGPPTGKEGLVKQTLQFGLKRNKITWRIKAPLGVDYYGLMFSYASVKLMLQFMEIKINETEYVDSKEPQCFVIKTVELLDDKIGLSLEGIKCITFRDLKGNLEKIYNKSYGVRREVRSTEPRLLSELLALYQGGLPNYMVAQSSFDMARTVEKQTEVMKYINKNLSELVNQNNYMMKTQFKLIDLLDKVVREKLG